jgi:predicted transcriptional regulator
MEHLLNFAEFLNESSSMDQYAQDTLNTIKDLAKKSKDNDHDEEYWDEYAKSKDFAEMISVEKMNRKTIKQAASSIYNAHS